MLLLSSWEESGLPGHLVHFLASLSSVSEGQQGLSQYLQKCYPDESVS